MLLAIREFLALWKDAFASLQSITTILALVIGGIWAYFKVFRGRIYSKRLEPNINASVLSGTHYQCMVAKICVKNVGLTRVDVDVESSVIEVQSYASSDYLPEFHNAMWDELGTTNALKYHKWIEPGETICEEILIALPNINLIALRIRLRLLPSVPNIFKRRKRTEWNAVTVVTSFEKQVHGLSGSLK